MDESLLQSLSDGARDVGVPLKPVQVELFRVFLEELLLWNRRINLVATSDPREIIARHVIDSLAPLPWLPDLRGRLLDIGSGGGFPGIPLKIARPELDVELLEASRKKSSFLRRVTGLLGLEGLGATWGRTEEFLRRNDVAASFDWVVSRAAFPPPRFALAGSPFLRAGGCLLVMAGPSAIDDAEPPPEASLERILSRSYTLPFHGGTRKIFLYKKAS